MNLLKLDLFIAIVMTWEKRDQGSCNLRDAVEQMFRKRVHFYIVRVVEGAQA